MFSTDLTAADRAACRAAIRGGSRSFFAASLLLPSRVREPAFSLYAFCRLADDAVDQADARPQALADLRERLERAYDGRPMPIAADRALADVVSRFAIPRALPEALLEGFAWDIQGRRYDDIGMLYAYAVRVAGTVGAMMAVLMGARDEGVVACACDLGVAMQLTNIARDVGEDARAGRLYLPRRWLHEAGIEPDAWLAQPAFTAALGSVVERVLETADTFYARADAGIAALPADCRSGVFAARLLYAEIGRELERAGYDSVSRRAVVPARRKARLLARALLAHGRLQPCPDGLPLEQARFLVAAVTALRPPAAAAVAAAPDFGARVVWVIDLFERLQRRQALGQGGMT
ncbi:MAG: Phytoene synthase [uncultured Microvirga sp.]|uniref:Phytoene synthase n=1 Tax=uncultured Microvirga sp. TaxID=412392 RepID=A0A6J4KZV0_9HYPH|nr:MAG: Phytoene synthase [uncultured Microvirga sp.]